MYCNQMLHQSTRQKKKSKGEKAMEKAITAFKKYQSEADERFQKAEEDCWKRLKWKRSEGRMSVSMI